jgi:hypothetical protein
MRNNFEGNVKVLLSRCQWCFQVIYVNAIDEELINEAKKGVCQIPKVTASTYNGRAVYSKYISLFQSH